MKFPWCKLFALPEDVERRAAQMAEADRAIQLAKMVHREADRHVTKRTLAHLPSGNGWRPPVADEFE